MLIVERMRYRPTDRPTDRPTNRPTDTASYRGALLHLKKRSLTEEASLAQLALFIAYSWLPLIQDVTRFFEEYPDAGAGKRARKEGLTNIKDNIAWKKANEDSLSKWLETQWGLAQSRAGNHTKTSAKNRWKYVTAWTQTWCVYIMF